VPDQPATAIKNKLFLTQRHGGTEKTVSALRTDKHQKKLLHHEGTKSTKFFNDSPPLLLRGFVVRILGCGHLARVRIVCPKYGGMIN
jgi:hypothetical protein